MERLQKLPRFSGATLKMIAVVCMLIDHTAAALIRPLASALPVEMHRLSAFINSMYQPMRNIGRIAFPIYCFLLVEGFMHTRSISRYLKRMLLFALISEIPFDFALASHLFSWKHNNVYFTLLIGLLVMAGVSYFEQHPLKIPAGRYLTLLLQGAITVGGLYLAKYMYTDYGFKGVFLIEVLFYLRFDRNLQAIFGAIAISWEKYAPLAFLPVLLYNGKRGRQIKYFFYWFYPAHLMILGFLKLAITGTFQL